MKFQDFVRNINVMNCYVYIGCGWNFWDNDEEIIRNAEKDNNHELSSSKRDTNFNLSKIFLDHFMSIFDVERNFLSSQISALIWKKTSLISSHKYVKEEEEIIENISLMMRTQFFFQSFPFAHASGKQGKLLWFKCLGVIRTVAESI